MVQEIINFIIGPFLIWLQIIAFWVFLALAIILYVFRRDAERTKKITSYKFLSVCIVVFKTLYVALTAAAYYYVWSANKLSELLLNSPLSGNVPPSIVTRLFPTFFNSDHGYFFFYVYGRYFINLFLAIGLALVFWAFLKLLKKRNERFFEEGETELGLVSALIVGWPNFVLFIPIVFLSVIAVSIIRGIVYKEAYTTLGWPFILSSFLCLAAGGWLIDALNLGVFRI